MRPPLVLRVARLVYLTVSCALAVGAIAYVIPLFVVAGSVALVGNLLT
jgi:hypothetical protein